MIEAYVYNNYGLELFRTCHLNDAYEKFKISYQILSDTKFHEASYPLNNMAVCEMFKGNYAQAVEYLTEGKYINQSIYAGLAIKATLDDLLSNAPERRAMPKIYVSN